MAMVLFLSLVSSPKLNKQIIVQLKEISILLPWHKGSLGNSRGGKGSECNYLKRSSWRVLSDMDAFRYYTLKQSAKFNPYI